MRLVSRYFLCAPSPCVKSVSISAPYPCALRASALAVALLLAASHGHAESKFTDPEDGAFDLSNLLLTHSGVLPVPTLITEPAVGYGLGLGLLYFSLPKKSADAPDDSKAPPNITGVGGFATGTHSWGAGLMHFHTWDDDHIRYLGVVGKVGLHLNYYGIQNQPRAYQLDGIAVVQQVLFRIGNSHWYVGPRYTFFDADTRFDASIPAGIRQFEKDQRVAKGGVVVDYDTRDNMFYPSSGTYAELEADLARGGLGSSTNFQEQTARGYQWIPLSKSWVLGLRAVCLAARRVRREVPGQQSAYRGSRNSLERHAALVGARLRRGRQGLWPSAFVFGCADCVWLRHRISLSDCSQARCDDGDRRRARAGAERVLCAGGQRLAVTRINQFS
jgi:hypothetical protein